MCWFVGAFTQLQKHPLVLPFPSIGTYQRGSYWTDFCEIWNWDFCENLSRESKCCWRQTKISDILHGDIVRGGGPKNNDNFFMEGWGAVLPSAPAWCMYVTALLINWPSSVLEERSIGSVWFFPWASVIVFVDFSMADLKEQHVCIKFCFLLGKTEAETVTMLQEAFKEEALSQARVYEWLSRFKRGDMSLEDQPWSGHPSTSRTDENIQKIRDAIMFDRQSFVELMSMNFNRRTSHESSCCETRSSLALGGSESQLFECLKTNPDFLSKIITFFPVSKNEEGP